VAETSDEFADAIVALLDDPAERARTVAAARDVLDGHSAQAAAQAFESVLASAAGVAVAS